MDPEFILLNGRDERLCPRETLSEFIARHGIQPRHVAVEVNAELIPREEHARVQLRSGDRVEIVTLVGGG